MLSTEKMNDREFAKYLADIDSGKVEVAVMNDGELARMQENGHPLINGLKSAIRQAVCVPHKCLPPAYRTLKGKDKSLEEIQQRTDSIIEKEMEKDRLRTMKQRNITRWSETEETSFTEINEEKQQSAYLKFAGMIGLKIDAAELTEIE